MQHKETKKRTKKTATTGKKVGGGGGSDLNLCTSTQMGYAKAQHKNNTNNHKPEFDPSGQVDKSKWIRESWLVRPSPPF